MAWYPASNRTNKLFSEFTGTNVIFLALSCEQPFTTFFIVMVGNNGYDVRVCFLRRILYGIDG